MSNNDSATTVAIIVPCYNVAGSIDALLSSLQQIQDPRIQVVFVDDGSTDDTVSKLAALEPELPIAIIRTDNKGPGSARNTGLRNTQAQYVWFVDADDRIFVRPVEQHLDHLEGADVVSFACAYDPSSDMLERFSNAGRVTAKIFRRDFLIEKEIYFADAYSSEDNYFQLQVAELYRSETCFADTIYEVIENPDSLTRGRFNPRWISRWDAIGAMLAFGRRNPRCGLEQLEEGLVSLSLGITWAYYVERGKWFELLILLPRLLATLRNWRLVKHLGVFMASGSRRNRVAKGLAISVALPLSLFARPIAP